MVKLLGLAIHQHPELSGLSVPRAVGATHIFSAFVDDSTLFLETADQLEPALRLVKRFGGAIRPPRPTSKKQTLFLNTSIRLQRYQGISLVPAHDTVQYLGYEVGTGELVQPNWAMRLRRVGRQLLTATTVAASVQHWVVILNAIFIPSVLSTSSVFDMPLWAHTELDQFYKRVYGSTRLSRGLPAQNQSGTPSHTEASGWGEPRLLRGGH